MAASRSPYCKKIDQLQSRHGQTVCRLNTSSARISMGAPHGHVCRHMPGEGMSTAESATLLLVENLVDVISPTRFIYHHFSHSVVVRPFRVLLERMIRCPGICLAHPQPSLPPPPDHATTPPRHTPRRQTTTRTIFFPCLEIRFNYVFSFYPISARALIVLVQLYLVFYWNILLFTHCNKP